MRERAGGISGSFGELKAVNYGELCRYTLKILPKCYKFSLLPPFFEKFLLKEKGVTLTKSHFCGIVFIMKILY